MSIKVLCVLEVDEAWLKTISDCEFRPYNFNDAFSLEMRWIAPGGIKLIGFDPISEEEAEYIISSRM